MTYNIEKFYPGIDTVTGFTTVTINDQIVLDEIFSLFVNSSHQLPSNLTRSRIYVGSWYFQETWLQSLGTVSNLNIYKTKLSAETMIEMTSGTRCTDPSYPATLHWSEMEWEVVGGEIDEYEVELTEVCDASQQFWFSLESMVNWYQCSSNCYKYQRAIMPSLKSEKKSMELTQWFMKKMFFKDSNSSNNLTPFPTGCNRFWLPITDEAEDGVWVDQNTGDLVEYFEWKQGEPNGGTKQNCGNLVPPGKKIFLNINLIPGSRIHIF